MGSLHLAPDIVEQIVTGCQPPELTAESLLKDRTQLPLDWESQHRILRLTRARWKYSKVEGFSITALLLRRLGDTKSVQTPSASRSHEVRYGARRRARLRMSVALIRDGGVAWAQGYGVANSITRRPVSAFTPFEGASLGKCVTTYAALALVQEGRLDLRRPLSSYLDGPPFVGKSALSLSTLLLAELVGLSRFIFDFLCSRTDLRIASVNVCRHSVSLFDYLNKSD